MSLNQQQQTATIQEFAENLQISGMTVAEVATELNVSPQKIEKIMHLEQHTLEDAWILRNYLLEKIAAQAATPRTFTALVGDHHDYWFLDGRRIDKAKMSRGED